MSITNIPGIDTAVKGFNSIGNAFGFEQVSTPTPELKPITEEQIVNLLENKPEDYTDEDIIRELKNQGYELPGYANVEASYNKANNLQQQKQQEEQVENFKKEDNDLLTRSNLIRDINGADVRQDFIDQILEPSQPWMEVEDNATMGDLSKAVLFNLIPSGTNVLKDIGSMAAHPIQTAQGIAGMGQGLMGTADTWLGNTAADISNFLNNGEETFRQKQFKESGFFGMGGMTKQQQETASVLGDYLTERYGSVKGFKKALGEDPVGVFSDITAVVSGGATTAGKLTKMNRLEDFGTKVAKIDPYIATTNLIGKGVGITAKKIDSWLEGFNPTKAKKELEDIVGKIIQGKPKDKEIGLRALSQIDKTDIETYSQLKDRFHDKELDLMSKKGQLLDGDKFKEQTIKEPEVIDMVELVEDGKTKTAAVNPFQEALMDLQELYTTEKNYKELPRINALLNKVGNDELTLKDLDNITVEYGIKESGFSDKTGQPLTSSNAKGRENLRKTMKDKFRTIADGRGIKGLKEIDQGYSDIAGTSRLVEKMEEKVNNLQQKFKERGLLYKTGDLVGKGIDFVSFGLVRGLLNSFADRNVGNKINNSQDLQDALQKNLKIIDKTMQKIDKATGPDEVKSVMDSMINGIKDIIRDTKTKGPKGGQVDAKVGGDIPEEVLKRRQQADEFAGIFDDIIRDGGPISKSGEYKELVARERFDIPKLKKDNFLSGGGRDRDVYDLGDGSVLKVAKKAEGLDQLSKADFYLADEGIIPEILERGENYTVFEKVKRFQDLNKEEKDLIWTFIDEVRGAGNAAIRYDGRINWDAYGRLEEMLHKYDWEALLDHDLTRFGWGDISERNLGIKNGKVILLDEGTIDLQSVNTGLRDPNSVYKKEFELLKSRTKEAKKKFKDVDPGLIYQVGPVMLLGSTILAHLNSGDETQG